LMAGSFEESIYESCPESMTRSSNG
jgi:hypothetical protein